MWRRTILLLAVGTVAGCQEFRDGGRTTNGGSDDPLYLNGDPNARGDGDVGAVAGAKTPRLAIDNVSSNPPQLTVPHTVVGDAREFSSAALDTDDEFSHVFATAGTYPYFCGVHPHMMGRIVVVK